MSKITGTGAGIKFLISAFNMVKRGEVKSLDELLQFAKQEFGEIDLGFIDQIKDTFKKGQASAVTEKRTKDIMKGDVVEEKGLSSLMKELEEKAENLKKTLDESKKSSLTTLEDALDAATGFRRSMGSKDKTKPFRTPDMPYQKENPNYRLPGGSMYAEGNLRTAIRQFLKSEIEAGNLKVNETDAFRVKEYSPMSEDDPIDVFRRYYGEDALQAADDMADALKEGTSFKNYEEIFRRDMPEIKVKTEGAGEYDAIIKETEALLKKAKDDADYAKTLDEFDVADRKKNNMGGINRIGFAKGKMYELMGWEGTGKSTICGHAVASCQAQGGKVVYIDGEHAVDTNYFRALGVNTETMMIAQPSCGEEGFNIAVELMQTGDVDLIIIDSDSSLIPKAVLDGAVGEHAIGKKARLNSSAYPKIKSMCHNTNTCVIVVSVSYTHLTLPTTPYV